MCTCTVLCLQLFNTLGGPVNIHPTSPRVLLGWMQQSSSSFTLPQHDTFEYFCKELAMSSWNPKVLFLISFQPYMDARPPVALHMEQTPSLRVNCKFRLRVKYEKKNYREYFGYAHQVVKMLSEFHVDSNSGRQNGAPRVEQSKLKKSIISIICLRWVENARQNPHGEQPSRYIPKCILPKSKH